MEKILVRSAVSLFDAGPANLISVVTSDDFEGIVTRAMWQAIEEIVAERGYLSGVELVIRRAGVTEADWQRLCDDAERLSTYADTLRAAQQLSDMAATRRMILIRAGIGSMLASSMPIEDIRTKTIEHLNDIRSVVPEVPADRTLRVVMQSNDVESFDWAVPNWLEHRDRVMITGREGGGKTTLLRQLDVQLSTGFHPWTGESFRPLRVLHIDLQDGRVRNEREFRWIAEMSGVEPNDNLIIVSRDSGLNVVSSTADRRWLEGLIRGVRPDVVALGPIYRLAIGEDATDSTAMQQLINQIDKMRTRYDVCWLLEAHSPKASMGRVRQWEPFGSQRFMAWPDAGVGLQPDSKNAQGAAVMSWRGNRDRLTKIWPGQLVWGRKWPWVPKGNPAHPDLAIREKVVQPESEHMDEDDGDDDVFRPGS